MPPTGLIANITELLNNQVQPSLTVGDRLFQDGKVSQESFDIVRLLASAQPVSGRAEEVMCPLHLRYGDLLTLCPVPQQAG